MKFFKNTESALKEDLESLVKNSMDLDTFIKLYNYDNTNGIIHCSEIDRFMGEIIFDCYGNYDVILANIKKLKEIKQQLKATDFDCFTEDHDDQSDLYFIINGNDITDFFFKAEFDDLYTEKFINNSTNCKLKDACELVINNILASYKPYLCLVERWNKINDVKNDITIRLENILRCYDELCELEK